MREINRVLVVGAGVMGHGFAQTFALNGFDVLLVDQSRQLLDRSRAWIRENLAFMVELDLIQPPAIEAALSKISFTSDLAGSAAKADYVLEAITEDLELKKGLFTKLGTLTAADVILATNTSSYDINELADVTNTRSVCWEPTGSIRRRSHRPWKSSRPLAPARRRSIRPLR